MERLVQAQFYLSIAFALYHVTKFPIVFSVTLGC
jgi:hypothetical protein